MKGASMTMLGSLAENILLCKGGNNPGVEAYGVISGQRRKILSLASGRSVYAIGTSNGTIAAGTNAGDIYWIMQHEPEQTDVGFRVQQVANDAPVLAISFVETSTIAVTDTSGQCLLRRLKKDAPTKELPTGGRIICALFQLDRRHLAGLAINGELLIWDWLRTDLVCVVHAPAPPEDLLALIRPVYWPATGVWVWPSRGGAIVFYSRQRNEMRAVCRHTGEVYAMVVCNEQLLTVGIDGCIRSWCPGAGEPVDPFEGPHGIISATSWQQDETAMLLLIDDSGEAGIYSWTDSGVDLINSLAGEDYRIAVGPDMEIFKLAVQQQKTIRVKELVTQINGKIARRGWSELDDCYKQLNKLGYPHVTLALRGQEARCKNDLAAELKNYNELIGVIPHEHLGSESSLAKCAELLESVWQLPKACGLYRELADRYSGNKGYTEAVQRLSDHINIIRTGRYVIELDIPLLSLIESATVLGERLKGRYLIEAMHPVRCGVVLCADEFIKEYAHLCQGKAQMPTAEEMELRWLSNKNKDERITTVVFRNEDLDRFNHIELGMKFLSTQLQTVLVPVTLLNADKDRKEESTSQEQDNRSIINELRNIEDDCFKGWLEMVGYTINYTIRLLITRKQAERTR